MRTPAGVECPFFYGNYHRGKNVEECRLIGKQPPPSHWSPDLCATCPVPSIKMANACEHMQLTIIIKKKLGFFKRYVKVEAFCTHAGSKVEKPHVGCGKCHPFDNEFVS